MGRGIEVGVRCHSELTKLCEQTLDKVLTYSTIEMMLGCFFELYLRLNPCSGEGGFQAYRTSQYALHYFESTSGLKFVVMTDPQQPAATMRDLLRQVYTEAYVECVAKHPVNGYERDKNNTSVMKNEAFRNRVDQILGKS